eukprot:1148205-Pelagomonas_calceolata.AAC.3
MLDHLVFSEAPHMSGRGTSVMKNCSWPSALILTCQEGSPMEGHQRDELLTAPDQAAPILTRHAGYKWDA